MSHKKVSRRQMLKGLGAAVAGTALAACQPKTVIVEKEVEKIVKETVMVEGTPKVVEKVVKETVIVEGEGSNLLAKAADEAIVSAADRPAVRTAASRGHGQDAAHSLGHLF